MRPTQNKEALYHGSSASTSSVSLSTLAKELLNPQQSKVQLENEADSDPFMTLAINGIGAAKETPMTPNTI